MAKKGFGKLVAFAAVTGAVAASVSYALRYKTFHSELEKDFREFEDGEDEACEDSEERTVDPRRTDRNYISLHASKDEFKLAAKDMAEATKNVLKDAGAVISDTAHEAVAAAVDTAHIALTAVKNKRSEFEDAMDEDEEEDSELFEDEGFLDDDYVDDDDLFDYSRTESDGIPAWKKPLPEETPAPAAPAADPAPAEEPAEPDQTAGAEKVTIEEDTI